ncbi:MAG: hypothetical protein KDC79_01780 [Cyclobacteriaceae bacterium]|nr:hypothetical protein [Cyclobacteriaceae bacterium]
MIKWTFLLTLITSFGFCQEVKIDLSQKQLITVSNEFNISVSQNNDQYLASRWSKGKLYYANGTSKQYDSLNFDRYSKTIEVVVNNKPLSIYPMGLAGALIYTGASSGYVLVKADIEGAQKLLEVCSSGKFILVKGLEAAEVKEIATIKMDEVRFEPKPEAQLNVGENYFVWNGESWKSFKLNKSGIGNLFNLDKKTLQNYISEQGISPTNKEQLILVFQHFNNEN